MCVLLCLCVEIQESKEEQAESRRAGERQEGESEFINSLNNIIEWDIVSTILSSGVQTYYASVVKLLSHMKLEIVRILISC